MKKIIILILISLCAVACTSPLVPKEFWVFNATYTKGFVVEYGLMTPWISLQDNNFDHQPDISPDWWSK